MRKIRKTWEAEIMHLRVPVSVWFEDSWMYVLGFIMTFVIFVFIVELLLLCFFSYDYYILLLIPATVAGINSHILSICYIVKMKIIEGYEFHCGHLFSNYACFVA